jgi:hypothetical protein
MSTVDTHPATRVPTARLLLGVVSLSLEAAAKKTAEWERASWKFMGSSADGAEHSPPRWRSVSIGALLEVTRRARAVRRALRRRAESAVAQVTPPLLSRLYRSRRARSLLSASELLKARILQELSHLEGQGRAAERQSRALVMSGLSELVDHAFERLAAAAEIREVVLEQGATLATEWTQTLQGKAAAADDRIERLFHRRRKH